MNTITSILTTSRFIRLIKILPFIVLTLAVQVRANVDHYILKGIFTYSAVPDTIAAGDRYKVTFDMDTSAIDGNHNIQYGTFLNAISNLTFTLDPGSAGNYAGGTMTASQFLSTTDNWYGYDLVNFYASSNFLPTGLNFGPAGSIPFVQFGFNLYSSAQDTFSLGLPYGESLGDVLPSLDLSAYDNTADVTLVFGNWSNPQWVFSQITSISKANHVPESPSVLFTVLVVLTNGVLLAFARKLRARSAE